MTISTISKKTIEQGKTSAAVSNTKQEQQGMNRAAFQIQNQWRAYLSLKKNGSESQSGATKPTADSLFERIKSLSDDAYAKLWFRLLKQQNVTFTLEGNFNLADLFRKDAALVIQKHWRGFKVRSTAAAVKDSDSVVFSEPEDQDCCGHCDKMIDTRSGEGLWDGKVNGLETTLCLDCCDLLGVNSDSDSDSRSDCGIVYQTDDVDSGSDVFSDEDETEITENKCCVCDDLYKWREGQLELDEDYQEGYCHPPCDSLQKFGECDCGDCGIKWYCPKCRLIED